MTRVRSAVIASAVWAALAACTATTESAAGGTAAIAGPYGIDTVRSVQQSLQDKGYDVGPLDGLMGPRTGHALRDFQQRQGLEPSGSLDEETLERLGLDRSAQSPRAAGGVRSRLGGSTRPGG